MVVPPPSAENVAPLRHCQTALETAQVLCAALLLTGQVPY
jgi:hypothetical protein